VLASGVLCGATLLGAEGPQRHAWLLAALLSGLFLVALDLHESGAFLLQIRGLVVLAKIGLLAALPWFSPLGAGWALAVVTVVSVLSSHTSSKIRYYVVLGGGRIEGARSKG
jgi:hypothetical protein